MFVCVLLGVKLPSFFTITHFPSFCYFAVEIFAYTINLSVKLGLHWTEVRRERWRHSLEVFLASRTTSRQAAREGTGSELLPHGTREGWTSCTTPDTCGLLWQRYGTKRVRPLGIKSEVPILLIPAVGQLGGRWLASESGVHDSRA